MESIKSILYNIALISILSGLFEAFLFSAKYKKYISYIVSIIIILSIISPLKNIITSFDINNFEYEFSEMNDEQNAELTETIKYAIKKDICNYFTLEESIFEINLETKSNNTETIIEKIEVKIKDENHNRYANRIEVYLKSKYSCEIKVIQSFKEKK